MIDQKEKINQIIFAFYEKARHDLIIGYHFNHIADFSTHLRLIESFWHLHLLGIKYPAKLQPVDLIKAHQHLKIKKGEIGRWVMLFTQTLEESDLNDSLKNIWLKRIDLFRKSLLDSNLLFPIS